MLHIQERENEWGRGGRERGRERVTDSTHLAIFLGSSMVKPGERIVRLKKHREFSREILGEGEQLSQLSLIKVLLEEKVRESLSGESCHVLVQLCFVFQKFTQLNKNVEVFVFFTKFNSVMILVILHCTGTRPTNECVCVHVCENAYWS